MATLASVGNQVVNALSEVVTPLIAIDEPKFVVVRKIYLNPDNTEHFNPNGSRLLSPKRRKIVLKTDKAFDKTGTFTTPVNGALNSPCIRFFTKASHTEIGDKEIEFKNNDNVFSAQQLTAGHEIFAAGAGASAALDDVELKLELEQGGKTTGPPATAKMTAVELTIDICKDRPGARRAMVSTAQYAAAQAAGPAKLAEDAKRACRAARAFAAAAKANAAAAEANVKAADATAKAADSAAKAEDAKAKALLAETAVKASPQDPILVSTTALASQAAALAATTAALEAQTSATAADLAATAAETAANVADTAAKQPDCAPGDTAAAKAAESATAAAENAKSAAAYARNPGELTKNAAAGKTATAQTKTQESRTGADTAAVNAGVVSNDAAAAAQKAAAANAAATGPVNALTATNAAATATTAATTAAASGAPPAIVTAANAAAASATAAATNATTPNADNDCNAQNAAANATAASNTPSYTAGTNTAEANDKMKAAAEANRRAAAAAAVPDVGAAQIAAGEAETAANETCAAALAATNAAAGPSQTATTTAGTVSAEDDAAAQAKTLKVAADKELKDATANKAVADKRVQDGAQNIVKLTGERDAAVLEQTRTEGVLTTATHDQEVADRDNQDAERAVTTRQREADEADADHERAVEEVSQALRTGVGLEQAKLRLKATHLRVTTALEALSEAKNRASSAYAAKLYADSKKSEAEKAKAKADKAVTDTAKALQEAQTAQTQAVQDQAPADLRFTNATADQSLKAGDYNTKALAAAAVAPVVIPAPDKVVKGRYLQRQVSPVNSAGRAQIVIRKAKPEQFVCTLVLKPIDAKVKAFEKEFLTQGEKAAANPFEVDNAKVPEEGVRFWAEGEALSDERRDTGFRLGLKVGGYEEADGDLVKATVFSLEFVLAQDPGALVPRAALAGDPTTTFVRFGLWDKAYQADAVKNGAADAANFVGSDTRRFFLRLRGPRADDSWPASTAQIIWKTRQNDWTDDDAPGTQTLTLIETALNSKVFISKAVMLVTTDTDCTQATDSGLTNVQGVAGARARGESDHRLRRAAIDGFVEAAYPPPAVADGMATAVTVFNRNPEERKRVALDVMRYTGTDVAPEVTANYIQGQFLRANQLWNQVGLQVDANATVDRAAPALAKDVNGFVDVDDDAKLTAALNDLPTPVTAENRITVVFAGITGANAMSLIPWVGTNAYLNIVGYGRRSVILLNKGLDLEDLTLAHELHHCLFLRFDSAVDRCYYTFNTNPPHGYLIPLPDVTVERRVQNLHSPDPDNDPANQNVVNWMRRLRTAYDDVTDAATSAADHRTGNTYTGPY